MILVDSGVWIDYFGGTPSRQADWLDRNLLRERFALGDLILTEVLQGCRSDRQFNELHAVLTDFEPLAIVDAEVALQAARHYRTLRDRGITVRKTIDTLIATRCILDRIPLLYSDRDFDPFVQHLGLRSAMDLPGVT